MFEWWGQQNIRMNRFVFEQTCYVFRHVCVMLSCTSRRISLSQSLLVRFSTSWCWWWADRRSAARAWQACWVDIRASSVNLLAPLSSWTSCWRRQRSASQLLLASSTSASRALLTWTTRPRVGCSSYLVKWVRVNPNPHKRHFNPRQLEWTTFKTCYGDDWIKTTNNERPKG